MFSCLIHSGTCPMDTLSLVLTCQSSVPPGTDLQLKQRKCHTVCMWEARSVFCRSGFWWVLGALLFHCCLFSPHKPSPLTATRCGLSAYLLSFVLSYIIQQLQGFVSLALQSWGNNKHFSSCFHLFWNYSYFTQSNCVFFLEFNWHRTLWHDCLWHVWQR